MRWRRRRQGSSPAALHARGSDQNCLRQPPEVKTRHTNTTADGCTCRATQPSEVHASPCTLFKGPSARGGPRAHPVAASEQHGRRGGEQAKLRPAPSLPALTKAKATAAFAPSRAPAFTWPALRRRAAASRTPPIGFNFAGEMKSSSQFPSDAIPAAPGRTNTRQESPSETVRLHAWRNALVHRSSLPTVWTRSMQPSSGIMCALSCCQAHTQNTLAFRDNTCWRPSYAYTYGKRA